MNTQRFVFDDGQWLRGNIHAHTTISDGKLSPAEVLTLYSEAGYDFIALTDHNRYHTYSHSDLICIGGVEVTGYLAKKPIHLQLLPLPGLPVFSEGQQFFLTDEEETRRFIATYHKRCIILLNHPAWSLLESGEVIRLGPIAGIEISNYSTELLNAVDGSIHLWECALREGRRWLGYGSDDNHNKESDCFGSWIWVKAAEPSAQAIVEAIEKGHFYSSEGPFIHRFEIRGGRVVAECSPVSRIIVKGERRNFVRRLGDGITSLEAPLNGQSRYLRLECTDEQGRSAYSNPIWLT